MGRRDVQKPSFSWSWLVFGRSFPPPHPPPHTHPRRPTSVFPQTNYSRTLQYFWASSSSTTCLSYAPLLPLLWRLRLPSWRHPFWAPCFARAKACPPLPPPPLPSPTLSAPLRPRPRWPPCPRPPCPSSGRTGCGGRCRSWRGCASRPGPWTCRRRRTTGCWRSCGARR